MHLILTGATGLVGSGVLDAMIKSKDITKISILSRRPVAMAEAARDPRINVVINTDFEKYDPAVLAKLFFAPTVEQVSRSGLSPETGRQLRGFVLEEILGLTVAGVVDNRKVEPQPQVDVARP